MFSAYIDELLIYQEEQHQNQVNSGFDKFFTSPLTPLLFLYSLSSLVYGRIL